MPAHNEASGPGSQHVPQETEGNWDIGGNLAVHADGKQGVTVEESLDGVLTTRESKSSREIKGLRSRLRRAFGRSKKVCTVPSLLRFSS